MAQATISQGQKIVNDQRKYFESGITRDATFRVNQLKKLLTLIKENEDVFCEAIFKDFKKSKFETLTNELFIVYEELHTAIKNVKQWSSKRHISTNLANIPGKCYQHPEPLGVSLIIGAWNYPYNMSLAPVVAAMAAGCTIVLKPSELPSNTSNLMKELISENFDEKYFAVVEGGIPETTDLLDQRWDKIFFTGSVQVGKIVYKAAAEHLTPVTLELGGKSPAIVTNSAKLPLAVQRIVWGKFLNSGQTCIAPDYVLVDETIQKDFLDLLVKEIEYRKYDINNGNYTQIINDRNFDRLTAMIEPDKVYHGGIAEKNKRFISPTIMTDITLDDKVMLDEIFGPILPVITFKSLDEAFAIVKKFEKPLSLYGFTEVNAEKRRIVEELSFGGGCINDTIMHLANPKLPFGGVGESGIGNYHGESGFRAFSHYKSVLEKSTLFELPIKYSPYSASKLSWVRRILGV